MKFTTRNELIGMLRSLKEINNNIRLYTDEIRKIKYLLFEKVKSPLDYDIVGYEKGETIRLIKKGNYVENSEKLEKREILANKLKMYESRLNTCLERKRSLEKVLMALEPKLRDIVIDKFIKNFTRYQIVKKYGFLYDMEVSRYIKNNLDQFIKENADVDF